MAEILISEDFREVLFARYCKYCKYAKLNESWGATCGILWLICMCFGLDFSLLIATGIWLILVILKFIS